VSEHTPDAHVDPVTDGAPGDSGTGHPEVDRVVASLDGLDERPVSEHVAVFEAAHDTLRNALADAGNDASGA
jgi:hypothetical protein